MTPYQELMIAVSQYYGVGTDQWAEIEKYGIAAPHLEEILSNIPGVSIVKNANGSIRSFNLSATENITSSAETAVNSNVPATLQTFDVPANTGLHDVIDASGETVKEVTFKSGLSKAGNFVFGEVAPRVAAVSAGITLGKTVDKLLYKANPDFWDEHGMETLNPDTWGEIIGTDTLGHKALNFILGTTPDNKTQAYMDENALAYMALYLQQKGVFATGETQVYENDEIKSLNLSEYINFPITLSPTLGQTADYRFDDKHPNYFHTYVYNTNADRVAIFKSINGLPGAVIPVSSRPGTYGFTTGSGVLTPIPDQNSSLSEHDLNDKTFYYTIMQFNIARSVVGNVNIPKDNIFDHIRDIAYAILYGDAITSGGVDGIGSQDGAKNPDLSNAQTVADTLQALKTQYPQLFENAVTQDVVQPDGTIKTYTYVPVATPDIDQDGNPISSTSNQAKPEIDPETATENLLKTIAQIIQKVPPTNPPDIGKGNTPVAVPPTGSASSLYAIYNPTLAQINAFGAWLWSDNFIEQIKKLFNDPMQAIIGLHKVYATPAVSGAQNIKVGYLDSGVSANVVSNQYTTIDCGTVSLPEYFHNVFDYSPYTTVNLYLPFIGIVQLDNADVMRSSIHIVYHVDVLSGACLAEVKVTRDSAGGTLYQYTGNASVTLPISSGSYMGIVSSIASIAGGIAGTIASGGAALPMIASAAGSALNARTKVEHSGSFSGNAGAMGGKIPYLIISRPQIALANEYQKYIGYPANFSTTLGSCSGFTKVVECHLENVSATYSELDEIDELLKEGIIV